MAAVLLLAALISVVIGIIMLRLDTDDNAPKNQAITSEKLADDEEIKDLIGKVDNAQNPEEKLTATMDLGNAYIKKGDNEAAYRTFKDLADSSPEVDGSAYVSAANAAQLLDKKTEAAEYYGKAIAFYKNVAQGEMGRNAEFMKMVQSLEAEKAKLEQPEPEAAE